MNIAAQFEPDPISDKELWQVVDQTWAFPVFVRWGKLAGKNFAEITPAVQLTFEQSDLLAARLKSTQHRKLDSGYAVHPTDLRSVARRANGVTPEKHFIWNEQVGRAFDGLESTSDRNDFLDNLLAHTRDDGEAAAIRMIWITLCNLMPEWLLSGKEIRFGDVLTLRALPLRKNWRQMLCARVPGLKKVYMTKRALDLLRSFFTGAARWLRSPELMETTWYKGDVIYKWNVFLKQGQGWTDAMRAYEHNAFKAVGFQDYMLRWSHIIGSNEEAIHEIAMDELAKENAPSGRVVAGSHDNPPRLGRNTATVLSSPEIAWSATHGITSLDDANDAESIAFMERAAEKMLAMPHEGSSPVDLRNPEPI